MINTHFAYFMHVNYFTQQCQKFDLGKNFGISLNYTKMNERWTKI